MTKKPSLYVVERKEVVILVVRFVLVTILSFTMGVKYGETSGRRQALDEKAAAAEVAEAKTEAGGHLGSPVTEATPHETATPASGEGNHGAAPATEAAHGEHAATEPKASGHEEKKDDHSAPDAHPALATPSPTPSPAPVSSSKAKDAAAESADAYLLNALKEAGIDSARKSANSEENSAPEKSLPEDVKPKPKTSAEEFGDSWVIQVASYNTEQEAKRHAERLRARSLEPLIFSGMDSQNGKWYRVALGKFADRDKAGQIARNYKSKGWIGSGSFVRRAP